MKEDKFLIGELTANVENLTRAVNELRVDVISLRSDLSELKLFKAKLIGGSAVVSVAMSMVSSIILFTFDRMRP